jgi:hypothetical protein
MTFGVNHLAHDLLLRLLLPKLAYGATVVLTTSDTHDPKTNPLAPKQLYPEQLAHPPGRRRRMGFSAGFRALPEVLAETLEEKIDEMADLRGHLMVLQIDDL